MSSCCGDDGLEGMVETTPNASNGADEDAMQEDSTQHQVAAAPDENNIIRTKIAEVRATIAECEELMKPMKANREKIIKKR